MRDTDFHPVQRTVELRDSGTVEIAELDFKILPWNAVDANAFEPEISLPALATTPARVLPFLRLPTMPTEAQLDEAELGARLMLNQLHADSGEPIEIHRTAQGVTVAGLVETEKRRRELQAGLQTVPNVIFDVQSDESLKANPSPANAVQSIAVASMPGSTVAAGYLSLGPRTKHRGDQRPNATIPQQCTDHQPGEQRTGRSSNALRTNRIKIGSRIGNAFGAGL